MRFAGRAQCSTNGFIGFLIFGIFKCTHKDFMVKFSDCFFILFNGCFATAFTNQLFFQTKSPMFNCNHVIMQLIILKISTFIVSVDSELLTRNIGYYVRYRKCRKFWQYRCKCVMIRALGYVNI